MFTLSQDAGVTFFPPNYSQEPSTTTMSTTPKTTTTTTKPRTTTTTKPTTTTTTKPRTTTTTKPTTTTTTKPRTTTTTKPPSTTTTTTKSTTTTWHTTTSAPVTGGVSVCLRFLADSSSINLFTLALESDDALVLSFSNPWYTLSWNRYYRYQVSLNPTVPLWSPVRTQLWTSVCVVLDSLKNVVQVFQDGSMSIRKIPQARMVWSGEPVLKVSGFDGQVTDLEVWDSPLENTEIFRFMQNYGSSGTVLTWSNIAYTPNGNVLIEDTYSTFGQGQPISSSSEGEEQPIRSGQGWDQRRRHEKKFNERRQRKRQML
uniref:Pentraxin (PTX) domain-containing protein n=1 Tax=Neogobius melanostomus TaxID=47308 RepID=A0A8C6TG26_9GOBI